MLPDKDLKCHRTGFEKSCRQLVSDGACNRWKQLQGTNPVTGAPMDLWDCIDNHAHTLRVCAVRSIESSAASVESMRNEAKKAHDEHVSMASIAVQRSTDTIKRVFTAYVSPVEHFPPHEDQKALPLG